MGGKLEFERIRLLLLLAVFSRGGSREALVPAPSAPKWQEASGGRQRPGLLGGMVPVEVLHGQRSNGNPGDFLQVASYQDARDLLSGEENENL